MPSERFEFISGLAIPAFDRVVRTPTSNCTAVRAEGHAEDRTSMPSERSEFISGLAIPEFDSLIEASTCDSLTIRTERHAQDNIGMPSESLSWRIWYCSKQLQA